MIGKFDGDLTRILEAAVRSADTDLVCYLTSFDSDEPPSDKILEAAASSTRRPYELIDALLVSRCRRISSTVIESALRNPAADVNLIAKLRVLGSVLRTKAMLVAMAENGECGAEMLQILTAKLDLTRESIEELRKGEQAVRKLKSQPDMHPEISDEAFGEMVDTLYHTIGIDEAWTTTELLRDLNAKLVFTGDVEKWGEVIGAAVSNGDLAVLKAMDASGVHIKVSKATFYSIAADAPNEQFLCGMTDKYAVIAKPSPTLELEEPEDAWDGQIAESINHLLDRGVATVDMITQEVVETAARIRGVKAIQVLFDRASAKARVSKAMVDAAVRNTIYGHALLPFLQERADGGQLPVDNDVACSIAAHGDLRVLALFSDRQLSTLGQGFFLAAASNPNVNVIEFLFRDADSVDTAQLEAVAANSDAALECLMRHVQKPTLSELQNSAKFGRIIAEKCRWTETLESAEERDLVALNEGDISDLIVAAAQNQHSIEMLRYLFRRFRVMWGGYMSFAPADLVPARTFAAAAGNPAIAPEMLRVLLNESTTWGSSLGSRKPCSSRRQPTAGQRQRP